MAKKKRSKYNLNRFIVFLRQRFDLQGDNASQQEVISEITKSVEFKGTNVWLLIFAIFIASLGLNVNSTAVVIGAMLISPLMGPLLGLGLSLGINDFQLLKKSFRNFLVMVVISILTSTFYFFISPYSSVQSELLARTSPTIFDVLIALVGGLAGMVAQTRKDRTSTVISGVAIATALMPPLCTVGFGIATGEWRFVLGALYLFLINTVFIALAAYIMVLVLKYDKKVSIEKASNVRMNRWVIVVVVLIIVPSTILTFNLMRKSSFESSADRYVNSVFQFNKTMVVDHTLQYRYEGKKSLIQLKLVGEQLSQEVIDNAHAQLASYGLENTDLIVMQADESDKIDITKIQRSYAEIIDEKNRTINELHDKLSSLTISDTIPVGDISREAQHITDNIESMSLAKHIRYDGYGEPQDTTILFLVTRKDQSVPLETEKLKGWLGTRIKDDDIIILTENPNNQY